MWGEQGLLRPDVDASMAAAAFMGMIGFILIERAFLGVGAEDLSDTSELADKSTQIFLEGILRTTDQPQCKKVPGPFLRFCISCIDMEHLWFDNVGG